MDELTYTVLRVVITVISALIAAYLIPYIKAKTTAETQANVSMMISSAVRAAEQTLQGGAVKKDEVVKYAANWLKEHNITITAEQLDSLIEAAVYQLKYKETV